MTQNEDQLLADLVAAACAGADRCHWCGIPIAEMTREQKLAIVARLSQPHCVYDIKQDPFQ